MINVIASATTDIATGLKMRSVWMTLASEDINDQHRRTTLGPAWLLVNYLAFAGTFVLLFAQNHSTFNYSGYVALGLFVWLYLSELMIQSVMLFTREQSFIKGTTLPLTVYVMRMTMQSLIRASYSFVGCVVIVLLTGTALSVAWLWSGLALALIVLASPAFILGFAVLGAYFPDLQFIVQNLVRIGMFLTPIFWLPHGNDIKNLLYRYNPFTYFLEIVRMPVLSGTVPLDALGICMAFVVLLWLLALTLLGLTRKQIVFLV